MKGFLVKNTAGEGVAVVVSAKFTSGRGLLLGFLILNIGETVGLEENTDGFFEELFDVKKVVVGLLVRDLRGSKGLKIIINS